jgi:hypothetical protein
MGAFGRYGTGLLFVAALVMVILDATLGLVYGIVFGLFAGLILLAISTKDRYRRSVLDRGAVRAAHWRAVRSGAAEYHSGPLTRLGTYRLPGVLAQTSLTEWKDNAGDLFGLVHTPATNHWAVTLECFPDDASLVDPEATAQSVDRFGDWLTFLSGEPGCLQVMVTVETSPGNGMTLSRELRSADPAAPVLTRTVADQIAATYTTGSSTVRTFVTLTYTGAHRSGRRDADTMAGMLATRLPAITNQLASAGAGHAMVLDGQSVTEITRTAYEPPVGVIIDQAHHDGIPLLMRWDSAGPATAVTKWDHYRHGPAYSRSWSMTSIMGAVHAESLAPLLRPHPGIERKRVTIIYQLHDPGAAPMVASKDADAAEFRVNTTKKPSRRHKVDQVATTVTADEQVAGHGLIDVGVIVTCTVLDEDSLADADAVVAEIGPAARLLLHAEDGAHAAGFAAGLPCIGLMPAHHSYVPKSLRGAL